MLRRCVVFSAVLGAVETSAPNLHHAVLLVKLVVKKFAKELNSVYIQFMHLTNQVQPVVGLKANAAETVVLLKILALGNAQVEAGRVTPAKEAFAQVRRSRKMAKAQ